MVANGLSKLTQATVSAGNCPAAHARRLVWHINARCYRTQSYEGGGGVTRWTKRGREGRGDYAWRQSDAPAMFSGGLTS